MADFRCILCRIYLQCNIGSFGLEVMQSYACESCGIW